MPLAAPIGSGLGILNKVNIRIIRKQTKLPLIIDAGLGTSIRRNNCNGTWL